MRKEIPQAGKELSRFGKVAAMKTQQKKHLIKRQQLWLLSLTGFILIIVCGYFYYQYEENSIHKRQYSELKVIANLKISQIVQWRKERLADANVIAKSPFIRQNVQRWFLSKDNILRIDLIKQFSLMRYSYNYENVFIVSVEGKFLFDLDSSIKHIDTLTINLCKKAVHDGADIMSDLYFCPTHHTIHFDIIAPIFNDRNAPIAVFIMRIDPYAYLYPLIQSWPTPSKSAETLIIRKDGDSVLFLNDLRHKSNTALKLKIPLTSVKVPAVQAVLGHEGIWEGIDYRGVKVLADIEPVPGSPWFMIAKVDRKEVLSELHYRVVIIIIIALILVLLLGIGISWLYNNRQKNIYRELLETGTALQESQEEFRATLYSIGDAVITTDVKGSIRNMNVVAEELTGWKEPEAVGKSIEAVFHIVNEETHDAVESPVQKVIKEGLIVGLGNHTLLISKDGKEIPIADNGAPINNAKGEITGVVLVFRDQTAERAAKKKLSDSETQYRCLFESAKDGILILDADTGMIVDVNPFLINMLGYSQETFLRKKIWDLGFFKDIVANQSNFFELHQNEYIRYEDLPLETADGRKIEVEFVSNVYQVNHHKVIQCNIRDITERKRAEKALHESEEKFRNVFENSPVGKSMTSIDGAIRINAAFCNMLGYTKEELSGMNWQKITHPDDIENDQKYIDSVISGERNTSRWEKRYIHKNGNIVWADVSITLQRDHEGKPLYFITSINDITERKSAEENLTFLTLRQQAILAAVPDIIMEVDNNKIYTWANKAGTDFFGNDVISKEASYYFEGMQDTYDIVHPLFIGDENTIYVESWQRRKDGEKRLLAWWCRVLKDSNGNVTGALSSARDITERKRAEEKVFRLNRTYAVLSNINQLIVREQNKQALFDGACKIAVEDGKFLMSWIGMLDEGTGKIEPVANAGAINEYLELLHITVMDTPEGRGPIGTCIREGHTVICNDIEHDVQMIPWREQALALGYRSSAAFPIIVASKITGALNFYSSAANYFNEEEIHLLEELSADVSYAIESIKKGEERKLAEDALRESERKFRETVVHLDEGFYSVTLEGLLLEHNQAFCQILGFDRSVDLKGSHLPDFWQDPDDRHKYLQVLRANGSVSNYLINAKTQTGTKLTVLASAHFVKDKDNRPLRIEGVFLDITGRIRSEEKIRNLNSELEDRIVKRTAELEASNKELEAFSYSVSHDLRAPLRHINGYVDLLTERFHDQLPEKEKHYLDNIADSARQMSKLIDDLLQFSRTGRQEMQQDKLDMNNVLQEVLERIKPDISGRNIKWDIDTLPHIYGDRAMLSLVWANLLNNAVKFTRQKKKAIIKIGFQEADKEYVFFVRDNGAGFDMQYTDKLFGVFQRLHSSAEFEGTGIGLANVHRIILKHGGRTWAEAELDKGAVFYFSLPKRAIGIRQQGKGIRD